MTKKTMSLFIPITKIDEEKRLVYGQMTAEVEDSSGEIWDYDESKPFFEKWSQNAEKTSGGKSLGNLRSMHQSVAAGKLTQFIMDDATRSVEIAAKVVDDAEWNKCLEGVYTGFSQGGRYVKRWKDPTDSTKTRYSSDPVEVSLVDLPCLPTATFEYVKADGSVEMRKFNTTKENDMFEPTNEEVATRAAEMAKAAGDETKWADHVEKAREVLIAEHDDDAEAGNDEDDAAAKAAEADGEADAGEPAAEEADGDAGDGDDTEAEEELTEEETAEAAQKAARDSLQQVWLTPEGKTFKKAADAVADIVGEDTTSPANPVQDALAAARKAASGEPEPHVFVPTAGLDTARDLLKAVPSLDDGMVAKSLWTVSRLADLIDSLCCVQESSCWGDDNSLVPQAIADGISQLGTSLLMMAEEELSQALSAMRSRGVDVALVVSEYSVENAAQGEMLKRILDDEEMAERVEKATADSMETDVTDDDALAKRAEADPVVKALLEQRDALKSQVDEAVDGIGGLTKDISKMREEMEQLRKSPAPMAPRTTIVGKGGDSDLASAVTPEERSAAEASIAELMKTADGRSMLADAAIRAAQAEGTVR